MIAFLRSGQAVDLPYRNPVATREHIAIVNMLPFEGRSCLVAGASGFLGGAIARRLLSEGARVLGIRNEKGPTFDHPNLTWVQADLRDPLECRRLMQGIDFLFICAARTAGAKVIRESPMANVTPNVIINAYLLEAAHAARVSKTLFISSGAAYPSLDGAPLQEDDMFKADPPDVYFHAGWMKRYAEVLARAYAEKLQDSMTCVIVRPSNVYGPGDKFDWERSHVTAALIRRVIERHAPIQVWGTGEDVRDLIYVDDFVEGALAAFSVDVPFFCVNICAGECHTVREIVETVINLDGYAGAKLVFDSTQPSTIARRTFSPNLAKQRLGFSATTTLREGLAQTIAWYRAAHRLADSGA